MPNPDRHPFPRHRMMWAWDGDYPVLVANDCNWRAVILEMPPEVMWQYVRHAEAHGAIPCPECSTMVHTPGMPLWMRERCVEELDNDPAVEPFFTSGMVGLN